MAFYLLIALVMQIEASDKDYKKLIAGYCFYFGPNLVLWCSKKQVMVFRSSTEPEYRALAMIASEVL